MRLAVAGLSNFLLSCAVLSAQVANPASNIGARLQYVVMLSRHGVRSPLQAQTDLNKFSAAPWPRWPVAPGILTPHGYALMKIFGAWDRARFSAQGLLAASGCADAAHVTILTDSDERTRSTGRALADGMMPDCKIAVRSQHFGLNDPLFRPLEAGVGHPDMGLAASAIAGRIGNAGNLTEIYRPQLNALDRVLAGCGHVRNPNPARTSIFNVAAGIGNSSDKRPPSLQGPVQTASYLVENMLLEYAEGMSSDNTGWGCVDAATLRSLMQINTAQWEYGARTPEIARMRGSNLLYHIERSMDQSVMGKPVSGALGTPGDKLLILVGHDSNLASVAGALNIDWVVDGLVDDVPPGGTLLFELWRPPDGSKPFVRIEYTAQTLDQMRRGQQLSAANPPVQDQIFVPGCSRADTSCSWDGFVTAVRQAMNFSYVRLQR